MLHAASLIADGERRVAVIVEPAHPARISPLLMAAYGLTEREQDVMRLVLMKRPSAIWAVEFPRRRLARGRCTAWDLGGSAPRLTSAAQRRIVG